LGPGFDAWFFRCCARAAEQRFASAGEAIAALAAALGVAAAPASDAVPSVASAATAMASSSALAPIELPPPEGPSAKAAAAPPGPLAIAPHSREPAINGALLVVLVGGGVLAFAGLILTAVFVAGVLGRDAGPKPPQGQPGQAPRRGDADDVCKRA